MTGRSGRLSLSSHCLRRETRQGKTRPDKTHLATAIQHRLPNRDATLPPWQAMQRCHWLRQPSLAHAAAAGPVALASFGKAARGSVAGPELRRREMHAIGPMAVPANRGVQARRAAALLASDCTAMASMDLCLWLRVSRLLHPCQGSRLFVGSVAWVSRTPGLWASAGAKRRVRDSTPVFVSPDGLHLHACMGHSYGAVPALPMGRPTEWGRRVSPARLSSGSRLVSLVWLCLAGVLLRSTVTVAACPHPLAWPRVRW